MGGELEYINLEKDFQIKEIFGENTFSFLVTGNTRLKINYVKDNTSNFIETNNNGENIFNIPENISINDFIKLILEFDKKNTNKNGDTARITFLKILKNVYKKNKQKNILYIIKKLENGDTLLGKLNQFEINYFKELTTNKLIRTKDLIQLSKLITIESLSERAKMQLLEKMTVANGNEKLKDKLQLEELRLKFNSLNLTNKINELNKIGKEIAKYKSYIIKKGSEEIRGGIPMYIIDNKNIFCVGYSWLNHTIFEYLGVEHEIGSGYKDKNNPNSTHSIIKITLEGKKYILDHTLIRTLNSEKDFPISKTKDGNYLWAGGIYSFGDPEKELIVQNLYNFYIKKQNSNGSFVSLNKIEKENILKTIQQLSPNNLLVKKLLKSQ